ncbi:MAG: hypothetical protein WDW38_000540 [Sanguina aurantia]
MGILDGFLGKSSSRGKTSSDASTESAAREEATPQQSSELHLPTTSAPGPDLSQISGPAAVAAANSFSGGGMGSGRLYDPYEGLSSSVGVKKSQAAFRLPERPEFVFEEEAAVRRRGWTENLQFYTGLGYITGATSGVAAGGYKFISTKPEVAVESLKLKTNRLLNSAGSFARPYGNGCAMLGLFFSSMESLLISQLDQVGIPDTLCTIAAEVPRRMSSSPPPVCGVSGCERVGREERRPDGPDASSAPVAFSTPFPSHPPLPRHPPPRLNRDLRLPTSSVSDPASIKLLLRPPRSSPRPMHSPTLQLNRLSPNPSPRTPVPEPRLSPHAAASSGALFRAPRGPRQSLVAGAVGAVGGGCITVLRQFFPAL